MAYSVTLSQIVTRAQQRSNLEGATGFITPSEWYDMVNQSVAEWYDMVRLTPFGGQYYRASTQFNTIGNQAGYPLPGNFLAMLSVDWYVSGATLVVDVRPFQEEDRNKFRFWPIGWLSNTPVFYQLWAGNIQFIPVPQSSFQIQINYVPTAPLLGSPGATLDSIDGWEEWIVLDVAIKALTKDGQTDILPALVQMQQRQESRIRGAAANRIQGAAEVVHDVTSSFDDWWQ